MLADEVDGLQSILSLRNDINIADVLQQVGEFIARKLLVIDNNSG